MMKVQVRFLPVAMLFALALMAAPLHAQMCRGGVDFSTSAVQGQLGLEFESGSSLYALQGGKGGAHYFGMGLLGVRTYENRPGNTYILGFGGGRTFQHTLTGKAIHCIEARGDFGTGPDATGPVRADESSSSLTFELTTGLPLNAGRATQITPYVGIAARYASVVTTGDLTSRAVNDFYELLTFGLGISVNGALAFQPYAQLPLGRDTEDPVFGMKFSLNIGGKD